MKQYINIYSIILFFFFNASCSFDAKNTDTKYKDQLISVAKKVYDRELTFGTGGDISLRIPGKKYFIIKKTGTSFRDLNYEKLSTVSLSDGKLLFNSPVPSHETDIHLAIYNMKPGVNAIMHVHAPFTTAWASCGKLIPAITQQSYKVLKGQEIIPYYAPGSDSLPTQIMSCYDNSGTSVVLMQNHGFFIIGKDMEDILYKAEVIENAARIAYLSEQIGEPAEFNYVEPITYKPD